MEKKNKSDGVRALVMLLHLKSGLNQGQSAVNEKKTASKRVCWKIYTSFGVNNQMFAFLT